MSSYEAAAHLGVSLRRVRALIDAGQLPGRQIGGRWVIPAQAVAHFRARPGGRPMSEHVAWQALRHLAFDDHHGRLNSRLRAQIASLRDENDRLARMHSWMAARGDLHRLWAFGPSLAALTDDDRLVVGGAQGSANLAPPQRVHAYAAVADLPDIVADYRLNPPTPGREPNIHLWAVKSLDQIPRNPNNHRIVAPLVAALDLIDDGDPRSVGEANDIIDRAWEALS